MRRGGVKGQGHNQDPDDTNHHLENIYPKRCQKASDIFDDFAINDSVFDDSSVKVIDLNLNNSEVCAYPATCQNSQLTIGQPKPTNI